MSEEIPFNTLGLQIPFVVKSYSIETQREIFQYLSEMTETERIGYQIAFDHLGTSFDICRSNGYTSWKKQRGDRS